MPRKTLARALCAAAFACAALLAPASAHAAAGGFDVTVEGPGRVTGTGIDCPGDCSESGTWRDDQTPPTRRLTASVNGTTVAWSGCRVVTASPTSCDITLNDVEQGKVTARFTDVQDPTVALTGPDANGRWGGALLPAITVAATAGDNVDVASVAFRLGDAPAVVDTTAPYGATLGVGGLSSGARTLTATATDTAGRTATASVGVTIDNTPPALRVLSAPADGAFVKREELTLTYEAGADATMTCGLFQDPVGHVGTPCPGGTFSAFPTVDGPWRLYAVARDDLHNQVQAVRDVTVDGTVPEAALDDGPAEGTWVRGGTSAAFTVRASDANLAAARCRLDAGAWQDCAAGALSLPNPADATRRLELEVTDKAGNRATAERRWRVDATAPRLTVVGPGDGATITPGAVGLGATATDGGAGVAATECALSGVGAVPCAAQDRVLAAGAYTFTARAVDAVGNAAEARRTFTVAAPGTTPPPGTGTGDGGGGGGTGGSDRGGATPPAVGTPEAPAPPLTPRAGGAGAGPSRAPRACVVPRVKAGTTLAAARRRLKAARCAVKVERVRAKIRRGRVAGLAVRKGRRLRAVRAGARLAAGATIVVRVAR